MKKEFVRALAVGISAACVITTVPVPIMAALEENSMMEQISTGVNETQEKPQAVSESASEVVELVTEVEQEQEIQPAIENEQEQEIQLAIENEQVEIEEIFEEEVVLEDLFVGQTTGLEGFINRMYTTCLGRIADGEGLAFWVNALQTKEKKGADVGTFFIQSEELQKKNLSDTAYIQVLYQAFFDRSADLDATGSAYWLGELVSGKTRNTVLAGFINSDEFQRVCDTYGIERGTMAVEGQKEQSAIGNFVVRFYGKCMGRTPAQDEIDFWEGQLTSKAYTGKSFAHCFIFSNEFQGKNLGSAEYIQELYKIFFDRQADAEGNAYWVSVLNAQGKETVFDGFVQSTEFKKSCDEAGILYAELTPEEIQAAYTKELALLIDQERTNAGKATLTNLSGLNEAASLWAAQLAQGKVYKDSNNRTISQDYGERGQFVRQYVPDATSFYVCSLGASTPAEVISKWKAGTTLSTIILSDQVDRFGVGYYPGNHQWVVFIIKKSI